MKTTHVCGIAFGAALSGWTCWLFSGGAVAASNDPPRIPAAEAVDSRYEDLAISCLTLGELTPSLEDLDPQRLDSIVGAIARVLEMHMEADFDSYLQAHRADVQWANQKRSEDVDALRAILAMDFNVAEDDAPDQWIACLRLFWNLLYTEPVLQGLDPTSARLEYRVAQIDAPGGDPDLSEYEKSFEDRRAAFRLRINNAMALPHRRTPEEIARGQASLAWFDFQVDVTLGRKEQYPAGILLRFVWDSLDGEWFLSRAVTSYPDHFDLRSSRCVLLF